MQKDLAAAGTDIAEARAQVNSLRESLDSGRAVIEQRQTDLQQIQRQIDEETKKLKGYNDELDSLKEAINDRRKDIVEADLQVTQLEKEIEKARREAKDAADKVAKREKEFEWIADESQYDSRSCDGFAGGADSSSRRTFGQPNSQYNFTGFDMGNVKDKCRQLEENHRTMKRKVNPKVLSMIDRCAAFSIWTCINGLTSRLSHRSVEKRERDLLTMYKQVVKDKTKIEETVAILDEHKKDTLEKTWEKVNRSVRLQSLVFRLETDLSEVDSEFGNIFAELLPGNFCKLQPPEGKEIMQGLEVKVRLGSVWKASLTELSGGQRSLIALSLIMSLLRFKP